MVTSAQLRAARSLLNWTVRELAEKAGVHRNTVTRAETDENRPGHAVAQIVRTLEGAGVEFTNGGQPGVRLRKITGAIALSDEDLVAAYLDKGPCFVRGKGGERADNLREALKLATSKPTSSIEILNQAVGQIRIDREQIKRLVLLVQ